ncbi:MAG: hypothetical protein QOJ65_366 [Fimbriimonadaceae bacterium]|jgi:hypothetical protein|nr:hypothetical protein [Fimbriimonadaceae bacterium]
MAMMAAKRRHWTDKVYGSGEWIARAIVCVAAAAIAFSLVPWLTGFRFVEIVAVAFAVYQLFGFLVPKRCLWCRVGLATGLAVSLFQTALYGPGLPIMAARIAMVLVLWACFGIMLDVLEVPRADYWRDRLASLRSLHSDLLAHR